MTFELKRPEILLLLSSLFFAACNLGGRNPGAETFASANTPGDVVSVTTGAASFDMIYANNQNGITFPTETDDLGTATLNRKFFLAETEVTNLLAVEVLQWAYDQGKFSTTVTDHNGLSATTAKYGGQILLDLSEAGIKVSYFAGAFTADPGFEDHPVVNITWYGAVMICNWLTEMEDGHTNNVVYSGITTSWTDDDTVEEARTGYRLPTSEEWEYAARYIGTSPPTVEDLASECLYYNKGGIFPTLTAGYYWTPGDYAAGATKDHTNETETRLVAWYHGMTGGDDLQEVAGKTENQLGLYDMCGNSWEWCFTEIGDNRARRGGSFYVDAMNLDMGLEESRPPTFDWYGVGLRFAKTQ